MSQNKIESVEIGLKVLINLFFTGCIFLVFLNYTPFTSLRVNILILASLILFLLLFVTIILGKRMYVTRTNLKLLLILGSFLICFLFNFNSLNPINFSFVLFYLMILLIFSFIYIYSDSLAIYPVIILSIMFYQLFMLIIFLLKISNLESNSIGLISFLQIYFSLLTINKISGKAIKIIAGISCVLNIIIIILTNSRTSLIGITVVFICFFFWRLVKNKQMLITSTILIISIFGINFYINLFNSLEGIKLNNLIKEYTGKNLFSGRQLLWSNAIKNVQDTGNYLWGMGNNTILPYAQDNLGYLHNSFVQVFYSTGIIGLMLFVVFLLFIGWHFKINNSVENKLQFSFFVGIIVTQNFEGYLIHPIPNALTLFGWITLGFILGNITIKSSNEKLNKDL